MERRLTLTFDNGPIPSVTPRVLDILRERGLHAHFFVLGTLVATPEGRALVERALAEGHLVGNHSYTHETPLGDDPRADVVAAELVATAQVLAPIVPGPKRFRPFGGGGKIGKHLLRPDVVDWLLANDYACVLWTSVPRDWEDPQGWPASALADIEARHHTVLVLHDFEAACLEKLPTFLDEVRARNIEITLDLPPDCVPLAGGKLLADISPYVAER